MSIYSPVSAVSLSPQDGRDSGRSPSVRSNYSVRKYLGQDSGLLPTPRAEKQSPQSREDFTPNLAKRIEDLLFSSPTSVLSMAPDSEEQPYLPGEFHASQCPLPGSVEERRMTVGSGRKLLESWAKSSRPGPSLKTLLESLVLSKAWYSRTCLLRWKAKATKFSRLLFQLVPSTPRTGGIGSGYLLTTPQTADASMGAVISKDDKFKTLKSGRLRRMNRSGTDGSAGLAREMAMLPLLKTPSSVETEGGVMEIRPGCDGHYKLRDQIAMLPTPNAFDARSENGWEMGSEGDRNKKEHTLPKAVGISRGLKLQPAFVEWMQGFPIGWTDLKLSAMPSSRKSHTRSSRQSVRLKA